MNKAYWIEYFQNVSNDFYNRNIVDVLQEVEKDITDYLETVAQQPLSGSADATSKSCNVFQSCRNGKLNACSTCKRMYPFCQDDWYKPIT